MKSQEFASNSLPLVTFLLLAYNQEKYIEKAIESALAQSYHPIQFIFSDDCSTDDTYEKILTAVERYHGMNEVSVLRNSENLHISGHLNNALKEVKGELLILGAGDDISLPHRVKVLHEYWVANNRPSAMQSNFDLIDSNGNAIDASMFGRKRPTELYFDTANPKNVVRFLNERSKFDFVGATEAFSLKQIKNFGGFPLGVNYEDRVISFRALLHGGILYVPETLVQYRLHGENFSLNFEKHLIGNRNIGKKEDEFCKRRAEILKVLQCYGKDLSEARNLGYLNTYEYTEIEIALIRQIQIYEIISNWWSFSSWSKLTSLLPKLKKLRATHYQRWAKSRIIPLRMFVSIQHFRKIHNIKLIKRTFQKFS